LSAPAFYRCPEHGRIPVRTGRKAGPAAPTAPCPTCRREMERAPFERENLRFVAVPADTYARVRAHAKRVGKSMGAVVDELINNLGRAA
jgi:hypothetical protein